MKPKLNPRKTYPRRYKQRGEWVELLFMARAAQWGLKIAKPYGDSSSFDAIVEGSGNLYRVQIKSTTARHGDSYACDCTFGTYEAGDSRKGVKKGGQHTWRIGRKAYSKEQADFLAAYIIPEDMWFIIPVGKTPARAMFLPTSDRKRTSPYDAYREAWHLLGVDEKNLTIYASSTEEELIAFLKAKIVQHAGAAATDK